MVRAHLTVGIAGVTIEPTSSTGAAVSRHVDAVEMTGWTFRTVPLASFGVTTRRALLGGVHRAAGTHETRRTAQATRRPRIVVVSARGAGCLCALTGLRNVVSGSCLKASALAILFRVRPRRTFGAWRIAVRRVCARRAAATASRGQLGRSMVCAFLVG